jgi:hypothetical protein
MVYSSPSQYQDNDQTFFAQAPSLAGQITNNNKPVKVYYNGSGLDDIGGPVPMVDISRNFNRSEGGILFSTTTKATITGKIMRTDNVSGVNPSGTGTAVILDAAQKMTDLFSQDAGIFQIRCGSTNILEGSGVKINSFNLNKNNDNWIFSADYTIDLEYTSPASGQYIRTASDAWSLEPMEEYIYTSFARNIKQKSEYHNPKLKPTAPSDAAKVPPNTISTVEIPAGTIDLNVFNIPQFKLSRRITAEGVPSGGSGNTERNYSAYLNAKDWVVKRLGEPFGGTYGAGISGNGPTFSSSAITSLSSFTNLFLYNHLRTTNFNELAGTYEVNETWLAMPTGIKYVEDYTIDSSTDEKFIRTVRVQGSIKGLMIAQLPIMSGASGLIPDKSGIIDLSYSNTGGLSGNGMSQNIIDLNPLSSSAETRYFDNKYQNALSGWIHDVKPYLYRRASSAIDLDNSSDDYIPSTITPQPGARNPVYSRQKLLNIIPISTNEGHDPRKGTISFSYEFNDRFRFISGVLAESISINQTGPVDVINEAFVLGRRLGPILQSLGSKTSAKKDLTFEVIVVPPSSWKGFMLSNEECPLYTGGNTYKTIQTIIEGFKPFGDRRSSVFGTFSRLNDTGQVYVSQDNSNWNPTEGRYTRTVGWIYQACNLSRSYLDD